MQVCSILQRARKAQGFCKGFTGLSDVSCQLSLAINFSKPLCNIYPISSLSLRSLEKYWPGGGRREGAGFLWALVCHTGSARAPKAWERLGSALQTWELAGRADELSHTVPRVALITPAMTDAITAAVYTEQRGAERSLLSQGIGLQG